MAKKMNAREFERSVLTQMTQDVISRLEEIMANGEKDPRWSCPWTLKAPSNYVSHYVYQGMNRLYLSMMGVRWLITPAQLRDWNIAKYGTDPSDWKAKLKYTEVVDEKTGEVKRKAPKRYPYVFYQPKTFVRESLDEDGGDEVVRYFIFKAYFGYSVEDIDGLEIPEDERHDNPDIPMAQAIVDSSLCQISYQGDAAFYRPSDDTITLPKRELFRSSEEFYSTAFHEMVHSTGAKGRLDRDAPTSFGSKGYAEEELTAELGSVMLCDHCHIANVTKDNSVAYLRNWIKCLKDDVRLLYKAASRAQKACDWILERAVESSADMAEFSVDLIGTAKEAV